VSFCKKIYFVVIVCCSVSAIASEKNKDNKKISKVFKYTFPKDNKNPFAPPDLNLFSSAKYKVPFVSDLQKINLSKIKLVGVWSEKKGEEKCLLVADVKGSKVGVVASVGDHIGQRGGRIKSINKNNIVVKLFTVLSSGMKRFFDKTIYIESFSKNQDYAKDKNIVIYK
jgi:hypothetical protein